MQKNIFYSFLFFVMICSSQTFSQTSWSSVKYPEKEEFLTNVEKNHTSQLNKYGDKNALEDVYKWRYEYLSELIENQAIIYNDSLYNFVNLIFEDIIINNPNLNANQIRFLISNSPTPNAISLGDGTFIINLGLIRKLDNEAQLAFVICHEISHFYLDHSNQSVIERYERKNSEEYNQKIEEITSRKFGKYSLIKNMLKKDLYKEMSYSRKHEKEADSLGLLLFKNTDYNPLQSLTSMKLLDTIDYYKFPGKIDYKGIFKSEGFKFKQRWLNEETTMFGGAISDNYFERDSIKSHPDTKLRASFLKNYIDDLGLNKSQIQTQKNDNFENLKSQADIEFIKSWFFYENYGRALFYCLKQLQADKNNANLISMSSNFLRLIYDSHLNHTLSQHVERPSSENEKEYNQFLNFLDNIRISEFADLSYHFHLKHFENLKEDRIFLENHNYFNNEQTKKQNNEN